MTNQTNHEYWKRKYHSLWAQHKQKTLALEQRLKQEFPLLGIRRGLGANSDEWLRIPPDQKGEPDLVLYHEYNLLCHIEVSGSDRVTIGPGKDIWIRPDKVEVAISKPDKYWFYMVYANKTLVLDQNSIAPYVSDAQEVVIRGTPERYVFIPYSAAYPENYLFQWIRAQIKD